MNYNYTIPIPKSVRLILKLLMGIVIASIVGTVYYYAWLYRTTARALPDEIRMAKQEGLPLTPADLAPTPPVRIDQNAAPLYEKITALSATIKEDNSDSDVIHEWATDAERQATRRMLVQMAPELRLVEQAASLPDCDFHRDWNLGPDLKFPEYPVIRRMARVLAARATLQNEAGQPEAALHTIWIGARMAHHVGEQSTGVASETEMAVEAIMDIPFEQILKKYQDRADIIRLAAQTEQTFGETLDIKHALDAEVIRCRIMLEMVRTDKPSYLSNSTKERPGFMLADVYEAHSLSFWRRIYAAINRSHRDPMVTYLAIKAVDDAEEAISRTKDGNEKSTHEFDSLFCPYFSRFAQDIVTNEAHRRIRRTTLALLEHRLAHHYFPDTLTDLSPIAPADPFIGQPLHYRKTGKGFLLYSVGANCVDDGGTVRKKKSDRLLDIAIAFPE